ncbi:pyridoxamine 5'-phosphate oxidase [Moheibacter stercoris]|uniref:Pyridoxine/pyridoxamine 5'-phosphate oxidase n=1 Tax=Moheibacter stercoris TaxID=1628251 RepID=A0ABV2LX65_9FLAO
MKQDLRDKRKDYSQNFINFTQVSDNPMELFNIWFANAMESSKISEPYAMNLATIGVNGFPKSRIVLLREASNEGFSFYTNYESEKGKGISGNSKVCLSFFWENLEQQIIIKGIAEKLDGKNSDEYFQKRPRESQAGALVSQQSSILDFDVNLEEEVEKILSNYEGKEIPRPAYWGGYLVKPVEIEFWQGRPSRLHDRLRYLLEDGKWVKERLAP